MKTVRELDAWGAWHDYPESWPRKPNEKRPNGTVDLTPEIERTIKKARLAIKRDIKNAGPHYPRDEVRKVLAYWRIEL